MTSRSSRWLAYAAAMAALGGVDAALTIHLLARPDYAEVGPLAAAWLGLGRIWFVLGRVMWGPAWCVILAAGQRRWAAFAGVERGAALGCLGYGLVVAYQLILLLT